MGIVSNKLKFHGKTEMNGFGEKCNTEWGLNAGNFSTPDLYH